MRSDHILRRALLCFVSVLVFCFLEAGAQEGTDENFFKSAEAAIKSGRIDEGERMIMQIIKACRRTGNRRAEAAAWLRFGKSFTDGRGHFYSYLINQDHLAKMIACLDHALTIAKELEDPSLQCSILITKGDFLSKYGQLDTAESDFLKVLELEKSPESLYRQSAVVGLFVVHYHNGNFNKALDYGLDAVRYSENSSARTDLEELYFYLGNVYRDLGLIEESIEAYQKTITELRRKNVRSYVYSYVVKNMARQLITQGRPAEALRFAQEHGRFINSDPVNDMVMAGCLGMCYHGIGKAVVAEAYFKRMIDLSHTVKDRIRALPSFLTIADFYFSAKRYPEARFYLARLENVPSGQIPAAIQAKIYYMLYKVDSVSGDHLSALGYLGMHKFLNDSIFNEAKSKQIYEVQTRYETGKKEAHIQMLRSKTQLQKIKLEQARFARDVTYVGIVLLLALVVGLFFSLRAKHLSNVVLVAQQKDINSKNEFLRSLLSDKEMLIREVHHRVKNNLQLIASLLSIQARNVDITNALAAFQHAQQRVNAMSMIHHALYQSEQISDNNIRDYINELIYSLRDNLALSEHILFKVEIDTVALPLSSAVPVGLILNEAITNGMRHAFGGRNHGEIGVSLKVMNPGRYRLIVSDDGIGLANGSSQKKKVGFQLIEILTRQLEGVHAIEDRDGVTLTVEFEADKKTQRIL